jgi:hypothetical protein
MLGVVGDETQRRAIGLTRAPLMADVTLTITLPDIEAHALADRLERNQRVQSDQTIAVKLIRALLAGRAAGNVIVLQDE